MEQLNMTPQILLVTKIFLLMGVGFLLRRINVIPEEGKKLLTDLVIDVLLPCSILSAFMVELTRERAAQTVTIFLLSAGMQLVCCVLARVLYGLCQKSHRPVLMYGTVCSNSGILGTPIAEGIFGAEGTLLAAVFLVPLRVVMWTLGLAMFTGSKGKLSLKRIVTHPCIAAVFIGVVFMLTGFRLPGVLRDTLSSLGSGNLPISMLLVGSLIADMDARLLFHRDTLYFSVIRLLVLPLALFLVCGLLRLDPLVRSVSVVLTAMPIGSTSCILALKYDADASFASACTAFTTVLSLIAVPLWCMVLL